MKTSRITATATTTTTPRRHRGAVSSSARMAPITRIAVVPCVVWAALLTACASGSSVSYHGLEPIAPSAVAAAYDGPVVQLMSVQLPAGIDRDELVQELEPGRFQVLDGDHWIAPLGRLARQTLGANLAARLPPGRSAYPGAVWPAAGAQLAVAVLSFSVQGGQAAMQVSWSVRAPNSTDGVAPDVLRGAQLALQTPSGRSPTAIARAWSQLLAQLADRITADLIAPRIGT